MESPNPVGLKKEDFETDQEVRWCPGCGDYSILAAVQRLLPRFGIAPEKYVFVSGIGCSSRFPYYMNTYGFHSIHGRAPAIATGVKVARPDLSVWLVTGDGDALSIGGNHFLHLLRRNVDLNVLLFNNRIYGLTKGQYSPTSEFGKVTKSTPYGSPEQPLSPISLALAAKATFVARTVDVDAKHMTEVLEQAVAHKGTSFVEIYQNCNIFNDGAFESITDRNTKSDTQLRLEHQKPLIFGSAKNRGVKITGDCVTIVEFDPADPQGAELAGVSIYDKRNGYLATALARFDSSTPSGPVPLGVFYQAELPSFETVLSTQIREAQAKAPAKSTTDETLRELYHSGETWVVT